MKTEMTQEDAIEVLQSALGEPAGLLIFTPDQPYIMQILYQARRTDPAFSDIHLKQSPEGLVVYHERTRGTLW